MVDWPNEPKNVGIFPRTSVELESNWTLVKHVLKYDKRRDIHEDEFCIVSIFNCALIGQ